MAKYKTIKHIYIDYLGNLVSHTLEKAIKQLKLFNETCEKLESFSFISKLHRSPKGFTITWMHTEEGTDVKTEVKGPDEESICAFILKYRLFIEDKDGISIRRIVEIYKNLPIPSSYLDRLKTTRDHFNYILDSPTIYYTDEGNLKIKEVHDMFIYGSLIHMDDKDKNRKKYLEILKNPMKNAILTSTFQSTLGKLIREIINIKKLNEEVLSIMSYIKK